MRHLPEGKFCCPVCRLAKGKQRDICAHVRRAKHIRRNTFVFKCSACDDRCGSIKAFVVHFNARHIAVVNMPTRVGEKSDCDEAADKMAALLAGD